MPTFVTALKHSRLYTVQVDLRVCELYFNLKNEKAILNKMGGKLFPVLKFLTTLFECHIYL